MDFHGSESKNVSENPVVSKENAERSEKEKRGGRTFENAPVGEKIRFIEFLLSKRQTAEDRKKLLSMLDRHTEERNAIRKISGTSHENAEITHTSERLSSALFDNAKDLGQFEKIEPFLRNFIRKGIPLDKEAFDDSVAKLSYALRALSNELEPGLARNKMNREKRGGERVFNLYDPGSEEPIVIYFRSVVAELNTKHFNDRASAFRMRP